MVKQASKKRRQNPLLPVFGIILAVTIAALSYFLITPWVESLLRSRGVSFGGLAPTQTTLLLAAVIWFLVFSTAMFLVAALAGKNREEERQIKFNKDAVKRKQAQKRERELRKKRQRQARRNQWDN